MFYCRKCAGKLYEEEIFKEDDDVWYMQIGCFKCSNKIYVQLSHWNSIKKKIELAIIKKRNSQDAKNKAKGKEAISAP